MPGIIDVVISVRLVVVGGLNDGLNFGRRGADGGGGWGADLGWGGCGGGGGAGSSDGIERGIPAGGSSRERGGKPPVRHPFGPVGLDVCRRF